MNVKKILTVVLGILLGVHVFAQNEKKIMYVSVIQEQNDESFDRYIVEDTFHEVLKSEYNIRIDQGKGIFSKALFEEMAYQEQGGVLSESITKYAQRGADLLCVVVINKVGESYYMRARIFDTATATIVETASYPNTSQKITDIKIVSTKLAAQLLSRRDLDTQANNVWNDVKKRTNGKALAYSLIPGVGLMMKGHKAEGVTYMIGDVALIGGGIAFMSQANKQKDIMNAYSTGIDQYKQAEKKYNNSKTAAYCCFGTAAALYVVNLVRAYVAEPKPGARLQWSVAPTLASSMYGEPNMSVNLSLCYKF